MRVLLWFKMLFCLNVLIPYVHTLTQKSVRDPALRYDELTLLRVGTD